MYKLDTLPHKAWISWSCFARCFPEEMLVSNHLTTTEQCQVAGGPFWDDAIRRGGCGGSGTAPQGSRSQWPGAFCPSQPSPHLMRIEIGSVRQVFDDAPFRVALTKRWYGWAGDRDPCLASDRRCVTAALTHPTDLVAQSRERVGKLLSLRTGREGAS